MSGDFRLRFPLWGSFGFICCVAFSLGCWVSIQYNLLEGCWEWILTQPWTQTLDNSILWLTWLIRLRTGISHLSISGILVHRCYISHCFYFLLFFMIVFSWSLFCAFVFMSLDSSFSNQKPILTLLPSLWLIIKLYYCYYSSITLYWIILLNCIIVD